MRDKYRVAGWVDRTIEADYEGDLDAGAILGLDDCWGTPEELRNQGFTVTKIEPEPENDPTVDPAGTVRKFPGSGDLIVKGVDGQWRYAFVTHEWANSVGDVLHGFPGDFLRTEKVF